MNDKQTENIDDQPEPIKTTDEAIRDDLLAAGHSLDRIYQAAGKRSGLRRLKETVLLMQVLQEKMELVRSEIEFHRPGSFRQINPDDTPLEKLDLSVRARKGMKAAGIYTVEQLRDTEQDKLLKLRGIARVTANEISEKLKAFLGENDV